MSGPADRLRQIPPERIWLEVDDLDSARAGLRRARKGPAGPERQAGKAKGVNCGVDQSSRRLRRNTKQPAAATTTSRA